MVLDADPAVLDYVYDILSDRFRVSLVTGAAELEQHLNNSAAPDLLLMDWNIVEGENEENALGLLARTHALKPLLPIVMLACSADLKEVITATQMGAADVVLKPFRKSDIVAGAYTGVMSAIDETMGRMLRWIVEPTPRIGMLESSCRLPGKV